MKPNTVPFEIKQLIQEDLPELILLVRLFNSVFEEDRPAVASEAHLARLLSSPGFIALAAVAGGEVVGGLTAYDLPMVYADQSEILLYDLAVKQGYQRMGIGKRLIEILREYCTTQGIREFFVLAHEEDEHAIEFYHATGGRSEKVVNFVYEAGDE